MNENLPTQSEDRLVTLAYIAERLGISVGELRRNIPTWPGFPKALKTGHRTVRFSLHAFNQWFETFKLGVTQPA